MKKMGFTTKYLDDGTISAVLNLKEEESSVRCPETENTEKKESVQPLPARQNQQNETKALEI
jgi:hypothetical protein